MSRLAWFEGNQQDYGADRHKRLDTERAQGTAPRRDRSAAGPAPRAHQPHRIGYKPPAAVLARRFAGDAARDLLGLHVPGNSALPHLLRRPHICVIVLPLVAPRRKLPSDTLPPA